MRATIAILFVAFGLVGCRDKSQLNDARAIADLIVGATNSNESTPRDTDVGSLLAPNDKTFALLTREMTNLGEAFASNPEDGRLWERRLNLRKAFEIATNRAAPLVPFLRTNYLSGQNPGDSGWALVYIGPKGWPTLLAGLTNENKTVRNCSASLAPYLPDNLAAEAVPHLVSLLTNRKIEVRTVAARSLGEIGLAPSLAIPALVRALENDKAFEVRYSAAKSLASYTSDSGQAKQALTKASHDDSNEIVRRAAAEALTGVQPAKGTPTD